LCGLQLTLPIIYLKNSRISAFLFFLIFQIIRLLNWNKFSESGNKGVTYEKVKRLKGAKHCKTGDLT